MPGKPETRSKANIDAHVRNPIPFPLSTSSEGEMNEIQWNLPYETNSFRDWNLLRL